jgi:predicted RNA-binding Zn ribbon-like protein
MYTTGFVPAVDARPGERPLDPVRRLLNSRMMEFGVDELQTAQSARSWLADQGYEPVALSSRELGDLRRTREHLREMLRGDDAAADQVRRAMARHLRGRPAVEPLDGALAGGVRLDDVGPARRPLQLVLAALWRGAVSGELDRLKVCADDRCQIAFYDRSRNRSREWCTSGECGNRNRVARTRQRRVTA